MSTFASGSELTSLTAIVARLRGAGCVFAEDEAELLSQAADGPAELLAMVERRAGGLPLEQVVGWADFCGLRVGLHPGVFVPRPRTALLVRRAAALAVPGATIVDLACGSGAIGLAVAARVPGAALHATDIDPAATRCARRNLAAAGGHVYDGSLYEPLPDSLRGRVDMVVASLPYVPTAQVAFLPAEARLHEALVALDGGADGLDLLRLAAAQAPGWLAPGGHLVLECGADQAAQALAAVDLAGLAAELATDEELGATVVTGSLTAR